MQNKVLHHRNITPSFIRFKKKVTVNRQNTLEQYNQEETQQNDRSCSRGSKCSFDVYEKRILPLSKLKANITSKRKPQQIVDSIKKMDMATKRCSSHEKEELERENYLTHTQRKTEKTLSRGKKINVTGRNISPYQRDKYISPKRTEDSLQKEEQQAKLSNAKLINNLITNHNAPNYLNKLKLKKQETHERKKLTKKKILNIDVKINNEDALKAYKIFGDLGKGAYGTVRMGINQRNDERVAVKVYDKRKLDQINKIRNLEREINILAVLDHPIIARLKEAIETPTQIYLILEYGGANSLYNYLLSKPEHRLPEWQAKQFIKTIAQTLSYLHARHIVHRDIKCENILINRHKQLKLIDFGFSIQSVPPSTIDTFCGTPTYMAPEIVSKVDHVPVYTDMWSLGVLFYVMLQGNYPFRAKTEEELFEKIRRGKFTYIYDNISDKSKELIEALLKVNPYERLTVNDVLSERYYDWLLEKN